MKRTSCLLLAVAASLILLAGCGSDRPEGADTTTSTTMGPEAAFAEQVNGICGDSKAAMGEIFGPVSSSDGPPTEEVLQSTYDALLTYLQGEQKALAALQPPEGQREEWVAVVAAHADAVAAVDEAGVAYFDDEGSDTFADVESKLVDMGFAACASDG